MQIGTPFIATATVAGTPATITVNCGFRVGHVMVVNKTTGDVGVWNYGMTDGTLMLLTGAAASIKSSGITPTTNVFGAVDGFTLGTATQFNDTGAEELIFVCFPNGMQT